MPILGIILCGRINMLVSPTSHAVSRVLLASEQRKLLDEV